MHLTHLVCTGCGRSHDASVPQNLCTACRRPLSARYDLAAAARTLTRESMAGRVKTMWRYRELLPVKAEEDVVSLGEGLTALLRTPRLEAVLGCRELWIKDEGQNPTQSFKARGMSSAVSMAKQFGLSRLVVPSAGNAATALAAYAARAGIEAHVFMPEDTSRSNIVGCRQMGAAVTLVAGFITDCSEAASRLSAEGGWFEMSTLREPYRIEGKKSLGFEIAEQLGWRLPAAIVYPTGGGSGLIGMWKAFDEMEAINLIGPERPRMYSVQLVGCMPIVRAFEAGESFATGEFGGHNRTCGLRVPKTIGDFIVLDILRRSGGGAVAVTEEDVGAAGAELGATEGIFAAPEGAASLAALKNLLGSGRIAPTDAVVLFNTGAGVKYLEWYD